MVTGYDSIAAPLASRPFSSDYLCFVFGVRPLFGSLLGERTAIP